MQVLKDSIAVAPNNGAAHHALGLALVRRKNYPEALDHLAKASALAPDEARFAYVHGVALKSMGKPEQSRTVLQGALQRHPWDAGLLNAMLSDALASGDVGAAAPLAKRLSSLRPDDQNPGPPGRQTRGAMITATPPIRRSSPPCAGRPNAFRARKSARKYP